MAAADLCDTAMTIPAVLTNQTGSQIPRWWNDRDNAWELLEIDDLYPNYRPDQVGTSQQRYLCDAVLDPKKKVVSNMRTLLEGFGWALPWSNGQHKLIIEDVKAASDMSLDADIIKSFGTIRHSARKKRLNRVTVEFPNANKNFKNDTVSWPALDSAEHVAFLAEDQAEALHETVKVETITDFYRAEDYAEFLVRSSRVGMRIDNMQLTHKAFRLEPADVVDITYANKGLVAKWFVVQKVDVSVDLKVTVDLVEYDASIYGAVTPTQEPLNTTGDSDGLDTPVTGVVNGTVTSQTQLPSLLVGGVGIIMDPTAPATGHDDGSTARIDIAAFTIHFEGSTVDYDAGSITGLAFETLYYIYTIDADMIGGAVAYEYTTDRTATAPAGAVAIGWVTTPVNGGQSSSGSYGGSKPYDPEWLYL